MVQHSAHDVCSGATLGAPRFGGRVGGSSQARLAEAEAAHRELNASTPGCEYLYLSEPAPLTERDTIAFELGRSVRELRERRGWSQTQLAKASGMTQSAVARFEAGGTVPTLSVLERLATALDVRLRVGFEAA